MQAPPQKFATKAMRACAPGGGGIFGRCRANMAHARQSTPELGLGFKGQVLKMFPAVPSPLESGKNRAPDIRHQADQYVPCPLLDHGR